MTKNRTRTRQSHGLKVNDPPPAVAPFASDDEMIEAAGHLFRIRRTFVEVQSRETTDDEQARAVKSQVRRWSRYWHSSFGLTNSATPICGRCQQLRLTRLEKEMLVVLLRHEIGLTQDRCSHTCAGLIQEAGFAGPEVLRCLRIFSRFGRLYKKQLILLEDSHEPVPVSLPAVDPAIVEALISPGSDAEDEWQLNKEADVYERLGEILATLERKSETMQRPAWHTHDMRAALILNRQAHRLLHQMDVTLKKHPEWKLAALRKHFSALQWTIILILLSEEMGFGDVSDRLCTGRGIACALAEPPYSHRCYLSHLASKSRLIAGNWIRPCGGVGEFVSDDSRGLEQTEFSVTEKTMDFLGIQPCSSSQRSDFTVRKPIMNMHQLVLSDHVRQGLEMALTQMRCSDQLMDKWGLRAIVPYGHSPVLLFAGPPGTGKTATAEALAAELKQQILVADYSQIQNCFVGETEKRIARVFREAQNRKAVLFWDEADAMFFDRDSADRNWEIRDVNVLLQQIERFEGVCILATNRTMSLDKALQRRITLKVTFDRPDQQMREQIWRKLLPSTMPLAPEVDLNWLSTFDLTGGEIKNVVLNAARRALSQDARGPVGMLDFREAIDMEQGGGWRQNNHHRVGFR